MPEETIVPPVQEAPNNQVNVAPNLDSELEDALNKSFGRTTEKEVSNEIPKAEEKIEQPKPEEKKVTIDLKKPTKETGNEVKKEVKPIEEDKPLPNPDNIPANPEGKNQAAWNALKNNYKRSFKSIEDKDQEITRLKAAIAERSGASQKEADTLKSQIEELSKYRAMIDIQADPEFVSKFDQPIEKVRDSIKSLFKTIKDKTTGNPISDEIINSINFTDTRTVDAILEHIEDNGDKTTAKRIQRKIEELVELDDKRNEVMSEQKNNYKKVLEDKKKESFSKDAENEGRMMKHFENVSLGKDLEGNQKYPPIEFLNKKNASENATQPEIDQINNHNRMVDLMQQKVKQALKIQSPEDRTEMAIAAVGSHYLAAQLKAAMAENASLKESLKKISVVNSETEKVKPSPVHRNGNGQLVDTETALANHFGRR